MSKTYVVIVAVSDYKEEDWVLQCPQKDALAMHVVFDRYGFEPRVVPERNLSLETLEKELRRAGKELQPGDSFIFYFSGHGKQVGDEQFMLLPGANRRLLERGTKTGSGIFSRTQLLAETAWEGVRRLFIFDACRAPMVHGKGVMEYFTPEAGAGFSLTRDLTLNNSDDVELQFCELNSCHKEQVSLEWPEELGGTGSGLFTFALVKHLRQALETGRALRIDQRLCDALQRDVLEMAGQMGEKAREVCGKPEFSGQGEVIELAPPRKGGPDKPDSTASQVDLLLKDFEAQLRDGDFDSPPGFNCRETLANLARLGHPQDDRKALGIQLKDAMDARQAAQAAWDALQVSLNPALEQEEAALAALHAYCQTHTLHEGDARKALARIEQTRAARAAAAAEAERLAKLAAEQAAQAALEAAVQAEAALWQTAETQHSIAGYQHYLDTSSLKLHEAAASERIAALQAAETLLRLLAVARKQGGESAWQAVRKMAAPGSAEAREAELALAALADEAAWQNARKQASVAGYRGYLASYPQGIHAAEARAVLASLADDADWAAAQAADTAEAYATYMARQPKGDRRGVAQQMIAEFELWQTACQQDTEAAYRAYQAASSLKRFNSDANKAIKRLQAAAEVAALAEDDRLFAEAQRADSLNAWQRYLDEAPIKRHKAAVEARMAVIRDDQAFALAERQNSEAAYEQYLQAYPAGQHAAAARTRLEALAWAVAQAHNTENIFADFIKRWPAGAYTKQAQLRLDALISEREEAQAWELACSQHTRKAYKHYLATSVLRRHVAEAQGALATMPAPKWPWAVLAAGVIGVGAWGGISLLPQPLVPVQPASTAAKTIVLTPPKSAPAASAILQDRSASVADRLGALRAVSQDERDRFTKAYNDRAASILANEWWNLYPGTAPEHLREWLADGAVLAEQGSKSALSAQAWAYAQGRGYAKDQALGVRLYQRAIEIAQKEGDDVSVRYLRRVLVELGAERAAQMPSADASSAK